MTILLSFLNFGPYHLARLGVAQRLAGFDGVNFCGLEMARVQSEYAWGEIAGERPRCASPNIPLEEVRVTDWLDYLAPILDDIAPDVCAIAGYSHPAMLSLITLCAQRSIPWLIMSDSREVDMPRKKWREWTKARVVKLASSGFAAGRIHIDYLAKLGLSPENCFSGYDVVDNDRFASEAAKCREHDVSAWRMTDGKLPPYFLSSSRFIPEKNLFRLLDAYALYRRQADAGGNPGQTPRSLCILGDGELKSSLVAHAVSLGFEVVPSAPWDDLRAPGDAAAPVVYLPGFRQINELPRFYAHADAAILASTKDTWGLVINEAMASSLPVLVSNRCGSAPELVREGANGYTFDPYRVDELAGLMTRLVALPEPDRKSLGETGKRIIADWGLDRFAGGLRQAADKALEVGPKKAGLLDRILLKSLILLGSLRQ